MKKEYFIPKRSPEPVNELIGALIVLLVVGVLAYAVYHFL